MAQSSGFFNAQYQDGEYDRVYNAEQFAAYFASFIGNGIFGNTMDELLPMAANPNNMSIDILSGKAWINGWWYENDETYNMPIALADGVLNRKDIVVVRWGNSERDVWLQVIQGEPAIEAVAPTIRRDADYFDLELCEINVPAGTSKITQAQITDTRMNTAVCGLVVGLIEQIDTTNAYLQVQSDLAEFKADEEADFEEWSTEQRGDFDDWYDAIKDVISESTAYNIFGMITENVEEQTQVSKTYAADDLVIYQEELREITSTVPQGSELNDNNSHKIALSTLINRIYTSFSNALTSLKNTAIAQAVGATGSTFTSVIAKLAEIVNRGSVSKTLDVNTTSFTIAQGYYETGSVNIVTQEKSVAPTSSSQDITPDSGKVLSKVVVNAVSTQEKAVTAGTSTVTVTPDSGKLLSKVTVSPTPSQSKSVAPSTSAQTVTPDSGKLLSSVSVSAITPNLSEDSRYQHEVNNSTPTLIGDAGFFTTVYDRVSRSNLGDYFEIRFNGSKNKSNVNMTAGWMNSNTLLALPSQTKTITASRSQQTVTPDSNKVLRSVTVNKYPDASGTYGTITSNGTHDMGATNNYRYVSVSVSHTPSITLIANTQYSQADSPTSYPIYAGYSRYLVVVLHHMLSRNGGRTNLSGLGAQKLLDYSSAYGSEEPVVEVWLLTSSGNVSVSRPNGGWTRGISVFGIN